MNAPKLRRVFRGVRQAARIRRIGAPRVRVWRKRAVFGAARALA